MQQNQELLCAWITNDTSVYFGMDSYKTGKYNTFQKAILIFNYYQANASKNSFVANYKAIPMTFRNTKDKTSKKNLYPWLCCYKLPKFMKERLLNNGLLLNDNKKNKAKSTTLQRVIAATFYNITDKDVHHINQNHEDHRFENLLPFKNHRDIFHDDKSKTNEELLTINKIICFFSVAVAFLNISGKLLQNFNIKSILSYTTFALS